MGVLRHETLHPMLRRSAPPAGRSGRRSAGWAFSSAVEADGGGLGFVRQHALPAGSGRSRSRGPADRPVHPASGSAAAASRPASRKGSPVRTAMRSTLPSARKKAASSRRAPRPSRSSMPHRLCASASSVAAMTSWLTMGSAKRCSAIRSGRARRGCSGCSRRAQHHLQPRDESRAQPFRQFAGQPRAPPCPRSSARHGAGRAGSCRRGSSAVMDSGATACGFAAHGRDGARRMARQGMGANVVPAMAPRTAKPWRGDGGPSPVASIAASPPNRCAAPVMSSNRPSGAIQRHQRREAVAPVGDIFQQRGIGLVVGRHDGQRLTMARALARGWPL